MSLSMRKQTTFTYPNQSVSAKVKLIDDSKGWYVDFNVDIHQNDASPFHFYTPHSDYETALGLYEETVRNCIDSGYTEIEN